MKEFYIQINQENIITDIIEYKVEGYIQVQLPTPLPVGINGGWHKYENGQVIEIPELNPTNIENRIQAEIDAYTINLIEMGLL